MSDKECHWVMDGGPNFGEIQARAELIAAVLGLKYGEWQTPPNRATIKFRALRQSGEIALILPREKANGHWVHTNPHSGECPDVR